MDNNETSNNTPHNEPNAQPNLHTQFLDERHRLRKNDFNELIVWIIGGFFFGLFSVGFSGMETQTGRIDFIIWCCVIWFIPLLSHIIFEYCPITAFKSFRLEKKLLANQQFLYEKFSVSKPKTLFTLHIRESRDLSQRIFTQSRAYLLVGCLISILGLYTFVVLSKQNLSSSDGGILMSEVGKLITENGKHMYDWNYILLRFVDCLPRFCILFFIEYIALFFLKQYKASMEEYRYYEIIKREREDIYAMYLLSKEYNNVPDIEQKMMDYFKSHSAKTPEISEKNRLKHEEITNHDMDVLSKLADFIKVVKEK